MTRTRTRPAAPAVVKAPLPSAVGALKQLAEAANKKHGGETMVPAKDAFKKLRHIPYGHLVGDLCSLGGLLEGHATQFIGREGAGKTTQAMRCVGNALRKYPGHSALWADAEQTFDPLWASQHHVDMDRLHLMATARGEDMGDVIVSAVQNAEDLIICVVDSINAMTPMKEYEDSLGDAQVALQARMLGRLSNHLLSANMDRKNKGWLPVTFVFINQWRSTIGGPPRAANKHMPGGRNFIHFTSTHVEFKAKVEQEKDEVGNATPYLVEHVFTMRRAKIPSSIRTGEYSVVVGHDHPLPVGSYDEAGTILAQAKKIGLWTGAGTKQQFEGYENVFRKMDEGIDWLEANPDEAMKIKRSIIMHHRERAGMAPVPYDGYLLDWSA